jgi:hypothetical protein
LVLTRECKLSRWLTVSLPGTTRELLASVRMGWMARSLSLSLSRWLWLECCSDRWRGRLDLGGHCSLRVGPCYIADLVKKKRVQHDTIDIYIEMKKEEVGVKERNEITRDDG